MTPADPGALDFSRFTPAPVSSSASHQRLAVMRAALQAESRDPATLRRTVSMDCELTDPGQAGGGSFAGLVDELARAIDAYERLGIGDLIVRLQPSTPPALDRLARAIKIRGH